VIFYKKVILYGKKIDEGMGIFDGIKQSSKIGPFLLIK
jgi:hypothetical protein